MRHPRVLRRVPIAVGVIALSLLAALVAHPGRRSVTPASAVAIHRSCPAGYLPMTQDGETSLAGHAIADRLCINRVHPETQADIAAMGAQEFAKQTAPGTTIPRNAYINAINARKRIL